METDGTVRYGSDGDGIFVAVASVDGWELFDDADELRERFPGRKHARAVAYLRGEVNATGERL